MYTYYNRSIMAIANVYTQRGQRRYRMCGVWSPLISDRLQTTYFSFFFYEAHMSAVRRVPVLICQFAICRSVRDLMATIKTRQHVFQQMANASRSRILKFQVSARGKKWHFCCAKFRESTFLVCCFYCKFFSHL